MKISTSVTNFDWASAPERLGAELAEVARLADDVGYDSLWVMDHYFQIPPIGPAEDPMLDGYAALAYMAAATRRLRLGTMVSGVTYRHPGLLVKAVTTLDVLSGGRAYFGIGAAWFEREHQGLGVPFPPVKERFERLEEALQIALQMWDESNNGPYHGKHYQLAETLNHPQAITRPHPPILVGGGGEKKTLRLVAQYADACNLFAMPGPDGLAHKLEVLKQHCADLGRDYATIEKTSMARLDLGPNGERADEAVQQLGALRELGVDTVLIATPADMSPLRAVEIVGARILPQVAAL